MFLRRLARENRWSVERAARVIEEYKRFMFLAVVAGHPVTPSEDVDQAWHLHLIYTRSYWDEFCGQVLGRPIHHDPTKGGDSERARHHEQYERTLASYRQWFGANAPPDVWPPAAERFGAGAQSVRVCPQSAWIVPKPWTWARRWAATPVVASAAAAPLVAGMLNPLDLSGPRFLVFYVLVCTVAIVAAAVARFVLRTDEEADGRTLTPDDVACLAQGAPGAVRAAVATLVAGEQLCLVQEPPSTWFGRATYRFVSDPGCQAEGPLQEAIVAAAAGTGAEPRVVLQSARESADEVEQGLRRRGLLESNDSFRVARWLPIFVLAAVWLLGAAKVLVGVSRGRPVVLLVILLVGLGLVMLRFWQKPYRTRGGDTLLRRLESENTSLRNIDLALAPDVASQQVALAAGLFGIAALSHPSIDPLKSAFGSVPPHAGGTNSSASSWSVGGCGGGGCGGGGCGGGCGGCGG